MNAYLDDQTLRSILKTHLDERFFQWAERELTKFADRLPEYDRRAAHTDREGQPRLIKYSPYGNDISEVWVNEGYKQTAEEVYKSGIVSYPHKIIDKINHKGNYIYSYAQGYLLSQVEPGFYCPVTLTMAVAYLLDHFADQSLKDKYLPHVIANGDIELFEGATFLTEKQGGSDVGANETKAVPEGDHYRLYGLKYFASNAGRCGVAAVLARIEGAPGGTKGLSLFLVPWRNDDGTLNGLHIRRLKDKLGVRAVPSAEVEFTGAAAYLIGDASKGFYYMMEALNLSRVCNAIASVGIMRRAFTEARKYVEKRESFGKRLVDFPLIQETLAKLNCRHEIQLIACFDMIKLFDQVMTQPFSSKEDEKAMLRLKIALLKIRTASEAIGFSHEAIELLGGNGFIEDFVTPRLLRDAQVLTVWEGPENILCLEVLRLIRKFSVHHLFMEEVRSALENLKPDFITIAQPVSDGLDQFTHLTEKLLKADEAAQTLYAKKITRLMTDIYLSVVALKSANNGNARDALRSEVFIQDLWKSYSAEDPFLAVNYFKGFMANHHVMK